MRIDNMKFDESLLVNAREFRKNPKATVHHSGRLGFNRDAESYMMLTVDSKLQLFRSAEAGNYFVAVLPPDADSGAAFSVKLVSGYYCANLKTFFDAEQLPYACDEHTIIFDIVKHPAQYRGQPLYELRQRVVKRRVASE